MINHPYSRFGREPTVTRFRVTFQVQGQAAMEQLHLEVPGNVSSCDDILRALGSHLKPAQSWPFAVASVPLNEDADLAERAVRMHRIRAACRYLELNNLSYMLEGRPFEIFCLFEGG